MGIFDWNTPESTILPRDHEPGILDYVWYDERDRRISLTGPYAVSEEVYQTTVDAKQYRKSCLSGDTSNPPSSLPPDIVEEIRYSEQLRKERGD